MSAGNVAAAGTAAIQMPSGSILAYRKANKPALGGAWGSLDIQPLASRPVGAIPVHADSLHRIRQRGERGIERALASATASCGLRPSRHAARKLVRLARSKRAGLPISASTLASHGRYEA